MEIMEKREGYFKKAKFWNMFLIIIKGIGSVVGGLGLPAAINPSKQVESLKKTMTMFDDPELVAPIQRAVELAETPLYRFYTILVFIVSVGLVVLFIMANKKIGNQEVQTKMPYYLYLGMIILGLVVSLATGSLGFSNQAAIFGTVFGIVWQLLLAVPAILVLVNLFKLDSN